MKTRARAVRASKRPPTILCAVDFGPVSRDVIREGARVAAQQGLAIRVVHVQEPVSALVRNGLGAKGAREFDRVRMESSMSHLADLIEPLRSAGVAVSVTVRDGNAAEQIVEEAAERRARMIVCGSSRPARRALFVVGTTPARLVRHSAVPVFVVVPSLVNRFRRVLVPTDLDVSDRTALRLGCELARSDGARVTVMHAYERPSLLHSYLGDTHELRSRLQDTARDGLEAFVRKAGLPKGGVAPHRLVLSNDDELHVADSIVRTARALKVDLIVMALGRLGFLKREIIGDVAERVLCDLPCSLLALPTAWAEAH